MSLRWRLVGEVVPVGVEEPDTDGSPKRPRPSKGGMAGLKGVFLPLGGISDGRVLLFFPLSEERSGESGVLSQ